MRRRLIIFDTTLREGEQAPGCSMLPDEKVAIALQLEKLNVDVIEAGFAASSKGDFIAIQKVAKAVKGAVISSLCRALEADVDAAVNALKDARRARVHVVFATSDVHLKYKFKMTQAQALERMTGIVKYASKSCFDIQFTAEDAGRTDRDFLVKVINAVIRAGASTVNLADTVGYMVPEEFGGLIKFIRQKAVGLDHALLSVHAHDDLGLALASSLAAIEAGAGQVECTINGIGDRAGICALNEIYHVLKVRQDYYSSVCTNIREEYLDPISQLVAQHTSMRMSA